MGIAISSDFKIKVLLCGSGNVGIKRIFDELAKDIPHTEFKQTMGIQFAPKYIKLANNLIVGITLWNLENPDKNAVIRETFFRGSMGAIFIVDCIEESSINAIKEWFYEVQKYNQKIPFVIVSINKFQQDSESISQLLRWVQENQGILMNGSGNTNSDLENALSHIAQLALKTIKV